MLKAESLEEKERFAGPFRITRSSILIAAFAAALIGFCVYKLFISSGPDEAMRREFVENGDAKVKDVLSGHKIKIKPSDKLVYAGIRSFEPEAPLGKQALERNRVLVAGKRVHVKFDEARKDKKGQWIGYVFIHNDMVNRQLVSEGLAFVHLREGQRHYAKELLDAQKEAMAAKRGIWSDSGVLKNTSASYIGDRKYASFHLPTCEDVKSIRPENRLVLTTKREAFENGLGPCEHCKP